MSDLLEIDASQGEGGGQVLRTALSLACITGTPVHLRNIRARRDNPGLRAQHLTAVRAAAAISAARVQGAELGGRDLQFVPQDLRAGAYRFDIGTAGAASLLLQTVLLPLAYAGAPSQLTVVGGTHVPWSPSYEYLSRVWLPLLARVGIRARLSLERAGFYPPGGGIVHASVTAQVPQRPVRLTERGRLLRVRGLSAVANLPPSIAERQRLRAEAHLAQLDVPVAIEVRTLPAVSKGTVIFLLAEFEHSRAAFTALGAPRKPAERVADEAAAALMAFVASGAAVDAHLADQLLLPLALVAGHSQLRTAAVTQHLLTNAAIVRRFLRASIEISGALGEPGEVTVDGTAVGAAAAAT